MVIDASTLAGVPVAPWPASDKGHFADFAVPNSVASAGMERVPPRRLALHQGVLRAWREGPGRDG